jgi:hypothetical protein
VGVVIEVSNLIGLLGFLERAFTVCFVDGLGLFFLLCWSHHQSQSQCQCHDHWNGELGFFLGLRSILLPLLWCLLPPVLSPLC